MDVIATMEPVIPFILMITIGVPIFGLGLPILVKIFVLPFVEMLLHN
jgi:hypothetical protein